MSSDRQGNTGISSDKREISHDIKHLGAISHRRNLNTEEEQTLVELYEACEAVGYSREQAKKIFRDGIDQAETVEKFRIECAFEMSLE